MSRLEKIRHQLKLIHTARTFVRKIVQEVILDIRLELWFYLMDAARYVAPYPAVVVCDDEDTWGHGYVWLISPREYEDVCETDGCSEVFSKSHRVYKL